MEGRRREYKTGVDGGPKRNLWREEEEEERRTVGTREGLRDPERQFGVW